MKKPSPHVIHDGNLTFADAMRTSSKVIYARCIKDDDKPLDHHGDWPEEGEIYPIRVTAHPQTGVPGVHILSFKGEAPYYNRFGLHRFVQVVTVWLN
jgi:hypothetical protein